MSDKVEKLKRAVRAAEAVQIGGGFIPPDAMFEQKKEEVTFDPETREIIGLSSEIDRHKLDELIQILEPLKLDEQSRDLLIRRMQHAVIDFYIAPAIAPAEQKARLKKFGDAMDAAMKAWAELGYHLQGSITDYVEERLQKVSGERFLQALEISRRIKQVMDVDAHAVIHGARAVENILKADTSHSRSSFEFQFCLRACQAWREYTGRKPAQSRGEDGQTGCDNRTPFERFIAAAIAPKTIGKDKIRRAVEAFNASVGEKS